MQDKHVPSIGLLYWLTFVIASIFGANLGDMLTEILALDVVVRALALAVALVAILVAERYNTSATYAWYWLAIIVIHAAAAKLADFSTGDLGFGRVGVLASLAVLLVVTFVTTRSSDSLLVAAQMLGRSGSEARPMTDASHWMAMIVASTLGAVLGDLCTSGLALGAAGSATISCALLLLALWLRSRSRSSHFLLYWLAIVFARALGTGAADFLATEADLPAGLGASAIISGTLTVASLLLWPDGRDGRRQGNTSG